jgi:hypothetical protein
MINYTQCITELMRDIVARLPEMSFINLDRVLVFARYGRSDCEGAYATCHSLNLPTTEPGYFYWRDRQTGKMTRRSEWFVTKSPEVFIRGVGVDYLISFALPRFCDQSLRRTRKEHYYPGALPWLAKLDTVVHELYHIDPAQPGIRRMERSDGSSSQLSHTPEFFEVVSHLVKQYLDSGPDPARYDFLRYSFAELTRIHGGVVGATFRNFPSFPQRYMEPLTPPPKVQPNVKIEPVKRSSQPPVYTEHDLELRYFYEVGGGGEPVHREANAVAAWSRRLRTAVLDEERPTAASRRRGAAAAR